MKKITVILLSIFFTSCNLKEKLKDFSKELEIINSDLKQEFNHSKLTTHLNWGTSDDSNYVEITFYEFNMDSKKYSDLKNISTKVIKRLIFKNPDFKNKDFIEVRFTEMKESQELNSSTRFRENNIQGF